MSHLTSDSCKLLSEAAPARLGSGDGRLLTMLYGSARRRDREMTFMMLDTTRLICL